MQSEGSYNPLLNMFTPAPSNIGNMQLLPPLPSTWGASSFGSAPLLPAAPLITQVRRFMHVQFAAHLPPSTAEFVIETSGIRGIINTDQLMEQFFAPQPPTNSNDEGAGMEEKDASTNQYPSSSLPNSFRSTGMTSNAPTLPAAAKTTFFSNMFTPTGRAAAATASAAAASASSSTAASAASPQAATSYDDGEDEEESDRMMAMMDRLEEQQ